MNDCMTTTGRPSRAEATEPDRPASSTPLRDLLNSMVGLLLDEITDGAGSDRLRRYVEPMTMVLALERGLSDQTGAARDAVARVQSQQMADLATGVLMARSGCDSATARSLLSEWLSVKGLDAETLNPAEVQTLLEEPDWGRR
jgi:hypothetical protein